MEESSIFFRGHDALVKNVNGASSCKIYNYSRVSDTNSPLKIQHIG